MIVGK